MNIIQCRFCKKPFSSLGGRICPNCIEQLDKDVITIRDYLDENKHADIDKISEDTEVPVARIMYLIKEERLIIDSPDGAGGGLLKCEACGAPINTGRLCENCKKNIASNLENVASKGSVQQKAAPADNFKRDRAKFRG